MSLMDSVSFPPASAPSDSRRRILFLLHCAPRFDAAHGGGRVIAHLLSGLADRHRLGVIYLRDLNEPPIDEALRRRCEIVEEVRWIDAPRALLGRAWHRLGIVTAPLRGMPRWIAHLPTERFATRVREIARRWPPDVVQLEFSVMGRYLAALDDCPAPRVLTYYMAGSDAVPSRRSRSPWWVPPGHWLDRIAWHRFERDVIGRVDAVVTLTEHDRHTVQVLRPGPPVHCILPGIAMPARPLSALGRSPPSVILVGNYAHPPNRDAAERLAGRIMPLVHRQSPNAVLYLVGDQPPPALRRFGAGRVIVTGRVPDVTPYLDRAALVAAPIRLGSGVHVKVLEALAAGKATVASLLAVEGLTVTDGKEVLLAESDEEFAGAITALLADPHRRVEVAARARAWACAHLPAERTAAAYERLYEELTSR